MKLKELPGKWRCTATKSGWTIEDIPAVIEDLSTYIREKLNDEPIVDLDAGTVHCQKNTMFWFLPKLPKVREGTLVVTTSKRAELHYKHHKTGEPKISELGRIKQEHLNFYHWVYSYEREVPPPVKKGLILNPENGGWIEYQLHEKLS